MRRCRGGIAFRFPVLVMWKFRLEPGEVLRVKFSPVGVGFRSVDFFAGCRRGRTTVPLQEAEILGVKPGSILRVGLLAEKSAKK